jgi:hypothetical protein
MPSKATTSTSKKAKSLPKSKKVSESASAFQVAEYKDLFYGTISAIAVYVFVLWAVDSGSLLVYTLAFASVYYTVHFFRLFIRIKFFHKQ